MKFLTTHLIEFLAAFASIVAAFISWHYSSLARSDARTAHSFSVVAKFEASGEDFPAHSCFRMFNDLPRTIQDETLRVFFGDLSSFLNYGDFEFEPSSNLFACAGLEPISYTGKITNDAAREIRRGIINKLNAYEEALASVYMNKTEPGIVCPTIYTSFDGDPETFLGIIDKMKIPPALFQENVDGDPVKMFRIARTFIDSEGACRGWRG